MFYYKKQNGFSLIELLIAIAFISVIILLAINFISYNQKLYRLNEERTKAMFFAMEGLEAIKLLHWSEIVPNVPSLFYSIEILENSVLEDKYYRTITAESIRRANSENANVYGDIVASGGHVDPDTKRIIITIDWQSDTGIAKQEMIETYIHLWEATRWRQTDWAGGAGQVNWSDETMFASASGGIDHSIAGIVSLSSGYIDWGQATTTAIFDTPGNFDDNDVYEVDDVAYLVTENNPSGSEFYILDVADIDAPFQMSSLNIGSSINAVVVQGDYAYLATDDNAAELQVIDINDPYTPFVAASYNLDSNNNAMDIDINATEAYIVQGDELFSFSIVDPLNPEILDEEDIDDQATEIFVSGENLYIATEDSDKELQIVDITSPVNINVIGQYDLPGSLKGTDVFVQGNYAYISTQNNGSGDEFFAFDITTPSAPNFLGSYNVGESIFSFGIVGNYALLGTNFLDDELLVLDIGTPGSMAEISTFDLDGHILGMSANCSVIYAATSSNRGEFFIISTEIVDCGYAPSGELESSTFDTGDNIDIYYNWIAWTGDEPLDTDIKFQVASSDDINGPWSFLGPDGTNSTYYNDGTGELINIMEHNNNRYMRYTLFLTSDSELEVPILEEVIISYTAY